MPGTPTTKYSIPTLNASGTDAINVSHTAINSAFTAIDGAFSGYAEGTFAGRPAAGKAGRIYRCTDTGQLFEDTGSAWVEIARLTTAMGAYRTIGLLRLIPSTSLVAGTYFFQDGILFANGGGAAGSSTEMLPINLTDHAVPGLSTRFRFLAGYLTNTVGTNITFTFGLYPLGSTGGTSGGLTVTLGTVVSGSTTAIANPSGPSNTVAGSDFTVSGSGVYLPGVVLSGTPTNGSVIHFNLALQVRNV